MHIAHNPWCCFTIRLDSYALPLPETTRMPSEVELCRLFYNRPRLFRSHLMA